MSETKKTYRTDDKAPSEMFKEVMYNQSGVGSDEMTCGWCNRLHLCPNACWHQGDDDEGLGWAEYCEMEKEKDPDGVVLHHEDDSISGRELNGVNFVLECPCNGLQRFENFIWKERDVIREYLKRRIDQEHEWAKQEKLKNKLAGMDSDAEFWRAYGN